MRVTQYDHLLQVKITDAYRQRLREASEKTGINMSELARPSIRLGLPQLLDELPEPETITEVRHE